MSGTTPVIRRAVFAVACAAMLVFGIVITLLGAVLPELVGRFGIDKASAGALLATMSFGILAGSVVFGPVADRYGFRGMLALAIALVVMGLEAIAFAPSLAALRMGIALIGFGGGIVNGGTNALVADIADDDERSAWLSILGVFFGVGAVGVPFALGLLLRHATYGALVAGVGALVSLPLLATLAVPFPAAKQAQGFPLAAGARLVRDPMLLLFGAMLFLQSGMEMTVGGWTATFYAEELALTPQRALFVLSLYWLGMMLARLALGGLLRRVAPARALLGCVALALAGSLVMLGTRTAVVAAVGSFLIGAGFAATFPVVLGWVGERHPRLSGTAIGIALVIALCGGMALPWAAGVVGASRGLRTSFLIVPTALVLLATLVVLANRRSAVVRAAG
jgi:fucose permease